MGYKKSPQQCCGLFSKMLTFLANIYLLHCESNSKMMMVMMNGGYVYFHSCKGCKTKKGREIAACSIFLN